MTTATTETENQSIILPVPASWRGRFLYFLAVILLPIGCFIASPLLRPEWQNGKVSAYATLLLDPQAALFFFPFLLFSMVCMGLLLFAPSRFAVQFPVRFGIYSGILLALQYLIVLAIALEGFALLIDGAFLGLWLLYWGVKLKFGRNGTQVLNRLVLLAGLAWFGWNVWQRFYWRTGSFENLLRGATETLAGIPVVILMGLLLLAPVFCLIALSLTSFKLLKFYETQPFWPLTRSLGWLAWLGGIVAAWRFSILKMFEIYASLPPNPPDCYIATAAAHGHKSLVQAQPVTLPSGPLWVNPQLQTLKCAELALLALAPGLHHPLRKFYDLVGKALARRLTNPWLADLAYLTLKPAEWLAKGILKGIVPEIELYAKNLYSQK